MRKFFDFLALSLILPIDADNEEFPESSLIGSLLILRLLFFSCFCRYQGLAVSTQDFGLLAFFLLLLLDTALACLLFEVGQMSWLGVW